MDVSTLIFSVAASAWSRAAAAATTIGFVRRLCLVRRHSNGVVAERIVKICLLSSPRQSVVESLAPLARVAGESFAAADTMTGRPFSRGLGIGSLALWEYRRATMPGASSGQKLPGLSRIQCLERRRRHVELAMAFSQTSARDDALKELSLGRQSIETNPMGR